MVSPPGVEPGLPGWNSDCPTTKLCVYRASARDSVPINSTWMTSRDKTRRGAFQVLFPCGIMWSKASLGLKE